MLTVCELVKTSPQITFKRYLLAHDTLPMDPIHREMYTSQTLFLLPDDDLIILKHLIEVTFIKMTIQHINSLRLREVAPSRLLLQIRIFSLRKMNLFI
jgi:hypothetical protein